ncbi:MAG: TonB-dependent receptor [Pseudomonadota bacterium]
MLIRLGTARTRVLAVGLLSLGTSATFADDDCEGGNANCRTVEEVVINAHPLSAEGLAQPANVLEGDALAKELSASLGDTVARLPGVQSATFGPAVGRPVIRGQGGPRVRVMEDRVDTMDASVASGDHATTVEPFIADRVEVLKGASTLLYGSGAIGGVVDVHTGRIPHEVPEDPISGRVLFNTQSNGQGTTAAGRLDGGSGGFAWHLDGFTRDVDPYDIPGFAESERLRALEAAEGEGGDDEEEVSGVAPGTQFEGSGGAAGFSWVGENAFVGAAVSVYDAFYGLPGGHEEEEEEGGEGEEEEGNPILDLEQTRVDLEAGFSEPFGNIESINLRLGINDYEHVEFEGNGEAGTRFTNEAWDGRAEFVHGSVGGFRGAFGVQASDRDFAAVGEEAFVQPVETRTFGIFWVGEKTVGLTDLEIGARIERVDHDPTAARSREFTLFSSSIGGVRDLENGVRISGILDISSRAPVSEELYSNGPHLATQSFDIGDQDLGVERAINASVTLDYTGDDWGIVATTYYTRFSDFIYQTFPGGEEDGLPIGNYVQNDARFLGADLGAYFNLGNFGGASWQLDALFDTVDASVSGPQDELPRVSPARVGVGLSADWNQFTASVDLLRVARVDDVPSDQLPTDAYNDVRLDLGWRQQVGLGELTVFLRGRNLTDDEQRNHTSLVKDFVPLPGRNVQVGASLSF